MSRNQCESMVKKKLPAGVSKSQVVNAAQLETVTKYNVYEDRASANKPAVTTLNTANLDQEKDKELVTTTSLEDGKSKKKGRQIKGVTGKDFAYAKTNEEAQVITDCKAGHMFNQISLAKIEKANIGIKLRGNDIGQPVVLEPPATSTVAAVYRQLEEGPRSSTCSASNSVGLEVIQMRAGYTGIQNIGNSCYMNAIVQCLASCPEIKELFLGGTFDANRHGPFASMMQCILAFLWGPNLGPINSDIPTLLREKVGKEVSRFKEPIQQDAQDFMLTLLNLLHEDLKRINPLPSLPAMAKPKFTQDKTVPNHNTDAEQAHVISTSLNSSKILDIFQGQSVTRLESIKYETFLDLTLPLPAANGLTLAMCLQKFVKSQLLCGPECWSCPTCEKLRVADKQILISRLPKVLIITLKRFISLDRTTRIKIDDRVEFPRILNMEPYLEDASSVGNWKYELFAIVNHDGDIGFGHYTAFARCPSALSGQRDECDWRLLDDSQVRSVTDDEDLAENAYILFYRSLAP